MSADALAKKIGNVDERIVNYAKTCKNGEMTTQGFKTSLEGMTFSAKAGQVALKGLAIAGNMLAAWAISKAISLAVKGIDNLIHASENARESMNDAFSEYESAKSEVESLNDELQTTNDRIDELNAKQNLSFVEQEELRNLQETNKELKVKIDLLEKEAALKKKDSAVSAVKSVKTSFGEEGISQDNINYKISNYRQSRLEGNNHPETFLMNKDDLEDNITALKIYNELLDEAYNTKDQENIEEYTDILGDLKDSMTDNLLLLYEQRDSMEDYYNYISKQDSSTWTTDDKNVVAQYERILKDIDYINQALSPEKYVDEKISGILAKVDFQNEAKQLEELGKDGSLSIDALASRFPDLIKYLNDAGVSAEELYQYIMALSNPDAINYQEVEKQFLEQLGIRDGAVGGASDQKIYDEVKSLGLLENESLEAYLTVRTKFTDGQTTEWSPKDWADYIQKEINGELASDEMSDLSPTITSSISQIATQLEPQFAKLGEAYKAIFTDNGFTLDDVDNSMLEGLRKSFAEIEEEVGVTFDSSKLNSFFDTLTNGNSSAEQVQQAFNDLATSYFYSTDTLDQLNEETAASIEKQLEELGVVNAHEVVTEALSEKQLELAETSKDLADATGSEIAEFGAEQIETGKCSEALALFYLKKALLNTTTITTANDCQNILDLATTANIGIVKLQQLQTLMNMITKRDAAVANGDSRAVSELNRAINDFSNNVINNLDLSDLEIDFSGIGGGTSSASKAGGDAGDAYVEAFEEELADLQDLRDRGVIDEAEYLNRLRELYTRYFADRKEYLDEYNKYERQYLEGMKSLYDSALSGISKLLSNKIDAVQEEKDTTISALEEERDARLEVIEAQKEQLQAEIDLIDEQIEKKQEIIDSINDEINKMREAADQRKRNLDLQKAQYELEKMQHQRTKLVNICQTL